jgi:hypothetical protein
MTDYENKNSPPTRSVNIDTDWEIEYWARIFKVNRSELKSAIKKVGNDFDELKKYFGNASQGQN